MIRRMMASVAVVALGVTMARAETGNPNLKSIQALTFGPNGTLVIGDGTGAQIVTVETGDVSGKTWTKKEIPNITDVIAGKLGTDAKGIQIIRLAVNPASHQAYVAVRHLPTKKDLVLTINAEGAIREFSLDKVNYERYPLKSEGTITKISDVAHAGDRILVAAQVNETFSNRIYSVVVKPDVVPVSYSTETYHVAHNKWETKAPIHVVMPYELDGKRYLVGAFTCTPIVKFGLDEMKAGAKVQGSSILELGSGNTPLDMFSYEKNGKKHILISTTRFHHDKNPAGPSKLWAARVDYDLLRESTNVNDKALWRIKKGGEASKDVTERANIAQDYFGVMFMDRLDNDNALIIRETKGQPSLNVVALP